MAVIAAGFLFLAVSVVVELIGHSSPSSRGSTPPAQALHRAQLVDCHDDVEALFEELGRTATELIHHARSRQREIVPQWDSFSHHWQRRYGEVDTRCRFTALADSDMGEGYKHTAQVFGELPTLRLKYRSLLVTFAGAQAADLDRMQRDLDRSRNLLLRPANGDKGTP